jgi:RHS repeat-associated protein
MFYQGSNAGIPACKFMFAVTVLLLTGAVFTFLPMLAQATTVAGRTAGTFAVSPSGAATYTIPIWAPPGPNGMQPDIALVYSSQVPGGPGAPVVGKPQPCSKLARGSVCPLVLLLPQQSGSAGAYGVGWSLQGLSSIYRCNLTFAQDAAPAPVALATGDGYCIDGQRLRLTSGTYGVAGSTYQTEIANFINVTAYGSAGNGPAYWVAQDRNGRSYTYGNGGNSQVLANGSSTAVSWMLNEVSDPPGNTMTVSYSTATGTAVPATISWTPSSHGSSTYNYTMTFAYGANVIPPQGYVGGTSFTNPNLLSSIAVAYSGTAVKTYYLTYTASSTTGRDTLTQVQECAGTGTGNCLLPTTVTYQAGAAGVGSGTTVSGGVEYVISTAFDFNGDGRNDLIGTNSAGALLVAFGSATGYGTPVSAPSGASTAFGDVDGSGVAGILANVSGTWYFYKWNGSAFAGTSTGISVATAASPILADLNGDGRADFAYTDSSGIVHVRLSTSTPGTVSFSSDINTGVGISGFTIFAQTSSSRALHFWGGSQADLIGVEKTCAQYNAKHICIAYQYIYNALHFTGSTFSTSGLLPAPVSSPISIVDFADYNDDGCTDVLTATQLLLSGCNGTATIPVALPSGVTAVGGIDWNGDGRRDVLVKQANGNLGVVLSTGSGLSSSVIGTSYSAASTSYTAAPNLTGDGQDGLIGWTGTSATYYLHSGSGSPPDLLTSVSDGYGNSASPTYVSLAQNNYSQYTDAIYPDQNYIGPMYVVSQATFSDPSSGSGGAYNQQFWYYGAWTNLQGRGFDSFYATQTYDSRNSLYDYTYYERAFPYTGMQFEDEQIPSNGSIVTNEWLGSPALSTLSSTQYQQRYFPYFSNVSAYRKEFGGPENGDLITTTSTGYTYDNYGNATSITKTVTDNDPNSPYLNQTWTTTTTNTPDVSTSPWCLGLLTETQVAYSSSLSGSNSVTRTKTFTPDTPNCRYTQIVTEPNSSQFKVTEALGYDSFGNVSSDTVTGAGMSGRTTTANWGTTGQFTNTLTDPSSATTTWTYTSAQSLGFGVPDSAKDANNLTTLWTYDGFGRKTQETRPDGTYTTWNYYDCALSSCLIGSHGTEITHSVYGVGGGVTTDGTDYLDPVDRPVLSNKRMLAAGTYDRNEVRYDSLGRVSERAFPCTWTSLATTCMYWTTNTYDVLNRLTQTQRPISSTNSNLQTTTYAYAGRTTTVTDPQSNARTTITDVNGWLRQAKDAYGYTVTTAYDAAGSKTGMSDSLGNTLLTGVSYNYGIAAFPVTATDMDLGAWSFTYDALGEMTGWRDAKGQSFSETYDALSRPSTRTEPDLFTQWTWGSSASSHNIGKLQSECTGTGSSCASSGYSESETYDSLGRQSQRAITISGYGTFTYAWAYNATTGLLNTLTYPASYPSTYALELQYGYSNGMLQTVTDISDTPNVTVWTANAMDPAEHVTQETLGPPSTDLVTNRSYDAVTGWLGSAQSGVGGGSSVKNLAFLYDEMGNVTQRQDNNLGLTENIYYDNNYRFSYSKLNGIQNLSVTYDSTGNITSRSDVANGASWTYSTTQKHAVTQAGSSVYQYSYDANGNAITRQGSTISWSSYNFPTTINAGSGSTAETVTFAYGPDRKRWQQMYTGNGTQETTNYVGGSLEVVASGGVTDYRHYISAAGEQIAVYSRKSNGTNAFSYLLSDQQASVASITNSSGAQVVGESFDAFGNRRNPSTWSGAPSNLDLTTIAGITREGYTFQTALGLWTGVNHMNGRVEDSITGRFLSADPNIPDVTYSQSYNRYSYVNNNPLSSVDPTGFDGCPSLLIDPSLCGGSSDPTPPWVTCPPGQLCTVGPGPPPDPFPPLPDPPPGSPPPESPAGPPPWVVCPPGQLCTVGPGPRPAPPRLSPPPPLPPPRLAPIPPPWLPPPETPVHGPWTFGRWCGPGGSGPPMNSTDAACQQHDYCYDRNNLTSFSNFGPYNAQLQNCNQQLCNAARGVEWAFQGAPFPYPGMPSPAEYNAASEIDYYFSHAPFNGNGCHP